MINLFKNRVLILVLVFVSVSCSENLENIDPDLPEGQVDSTDPKFDKRLFAIGQFRGPSTCTATYIEVPSQSLDSPAYILTNGHCVIDFYEDNSIYIDKPISAQVIFKNIFGVPEDQQKTFSIKKVAYSTMKGTDIAIVELDHTNRELQAAGIMPLKLATQIPSKGTVVNAFGYPLFFETVNMRGSKGQLGATSLIAEFFWLWKDFYAVNMKDIASGSSGSPVFEDLSKGIWGMINTTTIGAKGTCELGAPCEFGINQLPITKPETTYVLDVRAIRSSFNSKGIFDINLNSNQLEKPSGFVVGLNSGIRNFGKKDILEDQLRFTSSSHLNTSYRLDAFENYNWDNSSGFTPMTAETTAINFPEKEGFYVLTFLADGKRNRLTFKMDFTAPDFNTIQLNQVKGSDSYWINPVFVYPELVGFKWKIGPLATCDCSDTSDFETFNRNPRFVSNVELPVKVCVIGSDLAGNQTKVKEFILNK
jgi:V8-like Glu-specific endopeptidase